MKKQSFLQGALILMIAGLINRIIGFSLRIIIVRMVGAEGLGLFQRIFPLFMTLLLISTSGFPVAIAKLIPERLAKKDLHGSYNLLKVSTFFVLCMGTLITMIVLFSASFISNKIYNDSRTHLIILAILPAILASSLASCLRGFFQGMHNMLPTALSQMTEQISRFLSSLIILSTVSFHGLHYQAAGIALGISIGEFAGFILLVILLIHTLFKNFQIGREKIVNNLGQNYLKDFKEIASLALPITLGRIVNSLMMNGEAILIPRQLELKGLSVTEATSLYGQLSGMVEQLIYLPTVITIALTTSLVPTISDAYARNNLKKIKSNYHDVIRICCYIGFPITVIFYRMGNDLCNLLFAYPQAGELLSIMAFSSTFIYYLQVSHGMLNGLGKPHLSVVNMGLGSIIKLLGIFLLSSQFTGIIGAAISISLGIILSAILNFISIGYNIGYSINLINCFLKPFIASTIIYYSIPVLKNALAYFSINNKIEVMILLFLIIIIYLTIMFAIKAITVKDLKRFRK